MALTLFYAQLLGLTCLIIGIIFLAQQKQTLDSIQQTIDSRPVMFLAGIVGILLGLTMVLTHNEWSGDGLTLVVTILGWLILLRSILIILLPHATIRKIFNTIKLERLQWVLIAVLLVLGAYLVFTPG